MDTNTSINGISSLQGSDKVTAVNGVSSIKSAIDGDQIQSSQDLKQARLQGKSIPISEEQLVKAIDRAIKAMQGASTSLEFSIHEKTKHIIVKVLNKETGELIRVIPNEKSLDFLGKLWEMTGALVDERK